MYMKKFFLFLLCAALLLCSCDTSRSEGTPQSSSSGTTSGTVNIVPVGEATIAYTVSETNDDGISLKITAHGYRSESNDLEFYAKSNEYFLIDVEVTNGSENPVYYFLPRYCNEDTLLHNHEIGFDLSCGEYDLQSSSTGFIIARTSNETEHVRTLKPGETHAWQLKLAAGEISADDFDLPADGKAYLSGIKLYGPEIYNDGICTFTGTVFFGYSKSEVQLVKSVYESVLSVPLSVSFVYISSEPND